MQLTAIPADAEPLSESGYFALASDVSLINGDVQFQLARVTERGDVATFAVADVIGPETHPSRWSVSNPASMRHKLRVHPPLSTNGYRVVNLGTRAARAYAEVLSLAVELADIFDESIGDRIAAAEEAARKAEAEREERRKRYDEERKAYYEQQRALRAEQEQRAKDLYELLRWMLGDQIRLTRDGYRSTVFGTIDRVTEPRVVHDSEPDHYYCRMHITTERGKPMTIELKDINKLDTKQPDEKRFTNLYTHKTATAEGSKA